MNALHDFLTAVRAELGGAPEADRVPTGEFVRFSTNGKPSNRDGWLKWFADGLGGCYGCMRQQISRSWQIKRSGYLSPTDRIEHQCQRLHAQQQHAQQQRQHWDQNGQRNNQLWAACQPLDHDDLAVRYLRHRLRALPKLLPEVLRFHPGLAYWHDGKRIGTFPAMVAALTSPSGELLALHRTYLSPEGRKATLPVGMPAKKLTAASGPVLGGCIRLSEPTAAGLIGVAEGIETAMASSLIGNLPVVAAYSAAALAAWRWPQEVQQIAICGDNGAAGEHATNHLADRATAAGLLVHKFVPTLPDMDWCDIWVNRDECPNTIEEGHHA